MRTTPSVIGHLSTFIPETLSRLKKASSPRFAVWPRNNREQLPSETIATVLDLARPAKEVLLKTQVIAFNRCIPCRRALSVPLFGQQARQSPRQDSELTKENLGRVGASANQIQAVLRQQPGLMVELKRWVAQEAAANGQIVKDADLTDQKIFARLLSDTQFRSVATRCSSVMAISSPKSTPNRRLEKNEN